MARGAGVKVARGILYVLSCIVVVIIVVALIIGAYYTAMNTMNVNMLTRDAFAKRAQAVLLPSGDGSDRIMLEKLFAPRVIAMDEMLSSHYYDDYEIINYYEDTDVEFHIVWPWEDETTIQVTEKVRDISGKRIPAAGEDGAAATDEQPFSWRNGVYEVLLRKDKVTESWKIYGLELVEPIFVDEDEDGSAASAEPEERQTGQPSATPETSITE